MPVVLRDRGYAVFFYMYDLSEPIHVHVRNGRKEAKYWLNPLALVWNKGFREHELNRIEQIVHGNHGRIVSFWNNEQDRRR